MEESKKLVKQFSELINSPNTKKTFKQMVYGSHHPAPTDGWRKVFDEEKNTGITLEKNPSGYFIYKDKSGIVYVADGEKKEHEQTCIKFDELPGVEIIN